jgi:hypothetical protein
MSRNSAYEVSLRGQFSRQKANAISRGVNWELSFDDWYRIWEDSGKYHERGRLTGQYALVRKNPDVSFNLNNIHIIRIGDVIKPLKNHVTKFYRNKYDEKKHRRVQVIDEPINHWPLNWVTEESRKNNPFLRYCSVNTTENK